MPHRTLLAALTAFAVLFSLPAPVAAQNPVEPSRTEPSMDAVDAALAIVNDPDASDFQRCEAFHDAIQGLVRLGNFRDAEAGIRVFDPNCAIIVVGTPIESAMNALRDEIYPPLAPDDPTTAIDESVLSEHRILCERSAADACLVLHRNRVVQEWFGPAYRDSMEATSTTASIVGLLTGMMIADGKLSLDDPVARYVPEWTAGSEAGVTIRHLLSMTSGLGDSHEPGRPATTTVDEVTDKDSLVFTLPLVAEPGTAWAFSNEGAYLLSPILRRAAGEPLEEYAERRLFGPLGMESSSLHVDPPGQAWTHATMWTTPHDLARVGQLMLQRGQWEGDQIVPEAWIAESIRPSQDLNPDYGLMWWLDVPGGFAGRGGASTNLYVLPDQELVVVRMQSAERTTAMPYEPIAFGLFARMVRR